MRPKSLLLLVLALGCGLVASIGISQVLERNANQNGDVQTSPIYIAVHNINLGDPIDASMVSLQEWPKDRIPPGAIAQLDDLKGRRPRTAIIQGEPILDAKLLKPGQLADPITSIPRGFRLKTISVDATKSAAGLLSPGDRVDIQVFVKLNPRNGADASKSKIILQNIRVFAVDQTVQRSRDGGEEHTIAKTISLLLTPEQATKMNLAEHMGEISLIPRNPDDEEAANTAEFSSDDLLSDGGKSSREQEQGREKATEKKPSPVSSLLAAIQEHVPPPKPPFRMEIVEAQDVREILFDAISGRPIRDETANSKSGKKPASVAPAATAAPAANVAPTAPTAPPADPSPASDGIAPADAGAGQPEENFPIDLNQTKDDMNAISNSLAK
ncbi:MAG TPA: Flp pilus assembly protein CpaB [Lacipirellulaceae bacterium]|jgi:pilus assembly protein CpaB